MVFPFNSKTFSIKGKKIEENPGPAVHQRARMFVGPVIRDFVEPPTAAAPSNELISDGDLELELCFHTSALFAVSNEALCSFLGESRMHR
jgi:hypothetical protein